MPSPEDQTPAAAPDADETDASGVGAKAREPAATPSSGRKQAFDNVTTPLTPKDLNSPGTQKLVLFMLQQAQSKADLMEGYVERFHEADKRAAVLNEQLIAKKNVDRAVEIAVTAGTSLGGCIVGVALYFFGKASPDTGAGNTALWIGVALVIGSIAVKAVKR